jgi:uncharacterized membrane protein YdjX (TVP38/TMEM64 family)
MNCCDEIIDDAPSHAGRCASLSIFLVIGFFSLLGFFSVIDIYPLNDWLYFRLTLQKIGISGAILFIMMVATMPLAAPLSLIVMAGSSAYGAPLGMALSYIGCILNANVAYFLVKSLGIDETWGQSKRSCRVKSAIQKNGYPLVLALQFLTFIPFTAINSAAAASGVCWKDFMKATVLGIIPSITLFSMLGHMFLGKFLSPRFYFAFISVLALMILFVAIRKKNAQLRKKYLA